MDPDDFPPNDGDAFEALIAWYDAMGVDVALEAAPVDRFAESEAERAARAAARSAPRPAAPAAPAPPRRTPGDAPSAPATAQIPGDDAVMSARAAASSAGTIEALAALVAGFEGCNLRLTARTTVFGDGNPAARVMFVGEAPGRDEDLDGRPFVGRSGQLLDRMLAAVGLDRARDTYIGNVIYWRPPGNREPSDQEIAICRPFIRRQIELVDPDVLVFLGGQPAKALLGGEAARSGIRKLRGRWLSYDTGRRTIRALPTFHPAYLLRNPIEKRLAWRDMLAIRAALKGEG